MHDCKICLVVYFLTNRSSEKSWISHSIFPLRFEYYVGCIYILDRQQQEQEVQRQARKEKKNCRKNGRKNVENF